MNINMLRDADNDINIYAAARASDTSGAFRGASVYLSRDAGASYSSAVTIANASTMGETISALGNFYGGNIVDELNSVTVRVASGTLSSITNAALLEGGNLCVIGDEILCFRDAALVSERTYTLKGFLRGRRGSEYAMSGHPSGERFVLVSFSMLVRVPQEVSDLGVERTYKPVSAGATLAGTNAQTFTNLGTGLKPYAPVHLGGGRNAAGDITLGWTRRNRLYGEWRDSVDVPNSEASEEYVVEIFDGAGFSSVVRNIGGITLPTTTYSVADQVSDFGSRQSRVYFRVYQLSAVVGRGHAASGSV